MLKIKNYILFALFTLVSVSAMAQRPTVNVSVHPSDIMIGEQAVINLEVISPKGKNIEFPVYSDTLIKGIEVLDMPKIDTVLNEVMTLKQQYIITSFDSLLYHVPYMEVVVDGKDTIRSKGFGLKVSSPDLSEQTTAYLEKLNKQETDSIDFEQLEIREIKDIRKAPFVLWDYLPEILMVLGVLLLIALIIILIVMAKRKKEKGYFFTPKVVLPPHVVALDGLDKLKSRKLAQQGMEKEYYTGITNILRVYISNRYPAVNATEMLTDEILQAVKRVTDGESANTGLEQILRLADFVKFARYTPLTDENDLSMVNAYLFVNQTKKEEPTPEELAKSNSQKKPVVRKQPAAKNVKPSAPKKDSSEEDKTKS